MRAEDGNRRRPMADGGRQQPADDTRVESV